MALFGSKKASAQKARGAEASAVKASPERNLASVLIRPRITEKAALQNDRGVYTFVVRRDTTKYDIRDAVRAAFGVTPRKIAVVNVRPRTSLSRSRGRRVSAPGLKKALVYLKKGDKIDLM